MNKDFRIVKRDKKYYEDALVGHCKSAHDGEVSQTCNACKDIIRNMEKDFPEPKKSTSAKKLASYIWYLKGPNPSYHCDHSAHSRCPGTLSRNHGVKGMKCSCECHNLHGEDTDQIRKYIHKISQIAKF